MPAPSSANLIELAIDRGVPLFNHGHAAARAWRLRHALDATYAWLMAEDRPPSTRRAAALMMDEFSDARSARAWQTVNDTVMGGVSRSSMTADGQGTAVFEGEVSLENNGGFASIRRPVGAASLGGYDGIELRVRGDGQRYRFNVSERSRITPDLYRGEFETEEGEWTEVRLPFAEMARSVMGYRPPNSSPMDPAKIRSFGLSIGDKQAGPFRLEIEWIRAYRESR